MHTHHKHDHHTHHDHQHHALLFSILIIFAFGLIEAATGYWSHSLALLGDAGHMASDAVSLSIAAFAAWVAKKPPSDKHSYGLGRAEVVAAWLSSLAMLLVSIIIIVEAVSRLHNQQPVKSTPMMIIAGLGIAVNLTIAWMLARGQQTLNIRAALLHVTGDLLGSVAALVAGAVIFYTGWFPIDSILSIFISLLIMVSSIGLLRESIQVLMEGVPTSINIEDVAKRLEAMDGIHAIHDLHIWTLSSGTLVLSAHVSIQELSSWPTLLENLRKTIKKHYNIEHITLQPEPEFIDCQPCNR